MLVPYEVTSGGGSGTLKVVGSATKPATAEPGTVWVYNPDYDGCDIIWMGVPSSGNPSISDHTGKSVLITLQAASFRYSSTKEIINNLRVRLYGIYLLDGNTVTGLNSLYSNIMTNDGTWYYT